MVAHAVQPEILVLPLDMQNWQNAINQLGGLPLGGLLNLEYVVDVDEYSTFVLDKSKVKVIRPGPPIHADSQVHILIRLFLEFLPLCHGLLAVGEPLDEGSEDQIVFDRVQQLVSLLLRHLQHEVELVIELITPVLRQYGLMDVLNRQPQIG